MRGVIVVLQEFKEGEVHTAEGGLGYKEYTGRWEGRAKGTKVK